MCIRDRAETILKLPSALQGNETLVDEGSHVRIHIQSESFTETGVPPVRILRQGQPVSGQDVYKRQALCGAVQRKYSFLTLS